MRHQRTRLPLLATVLVVTTIAVAADDPAHERHELMEGVRDAAKPVGEMLQGEREYDAATVMATLETWGNAAKEFGGLFPPGSEGGEAAAAIWSDRAGFDKALATWAEAIDRAVAANPGTLDDAKPVLGVAFKACKNCHDTYRIEDE